MLSRLATLSLSVLVCGAVAFAEPPPQLPYGLDNLPIPNLPVTNQTNARTVKLLGEALGRAKTLERVQFARELGETERTDAIPLLLPLLNESDPMVRQQAIESIGMIKQQPSAASIKPFLKDPVESVRRQAVITLASLGDASAVADGLNDKDPEVVRAAINAGSAEHAAAIVNKLPSLPPASQVQAMGALGRLKHAGGIEAVAKFLDQPIPLKVAALQALAKIEATAKVDPVLALLKDPHPSARREALLALLGVAAVPVRQERAIAMLNDPDMTVRQAAATVLRKHPTPTAIAPLTEQLSIEYKPLHLESRDALVSIGPDTIPTAVKLMDHAVPERRIDGSWILGRLKSDAGFARHLELLKDKNWFVIAQAAESLGYVGNEGAKEPLTDLVKLCLSKAPPNQVGEGGATTFRAGEMAIISAAMLKHQPILGVVRDIRFDKNQPADMRGAAAWAMGMLAGEEAKGDFKRYIDLQDDEMEASNVKGEGMKAVGNATVKSLLPHLLAARGAVINSDWLTHWTKDRLEGKVTPFSPLIPRYPDLSIVDRP